MLFKIPKGTRNNFFEMYRQFGLAPSKRFACPAPSHVLTGLKITRNRSLYIFYRDWRNFYTHTSRATPRTCPSSLFICSFDAIKYATFAKNWEVLWKVWTIFRKGLQVSNRNRVKLSRNEFELQWIINLCTLIWTSIQLDRLILYYVIKTLDDVLNFA